MTDSDNVLKRASQVLAEAGSLLGNWRALRAELEVMPAGNAAARAERDVYLAILERLENGLVSGLEAALERLRSGHQTAAEAWLREQIEGLRE